MQKTKKLWHHIQNNAYTMLPNTMCMIGSGMKLQRFIHAKMRFHAQ